MAASGIIIVGGYFCRWRVNYGMIGPFAVKHGGGAWWGIAMVGHKNIIRKF